jgi:hypothetical protein
MNLVPPSSRFFLQQWPQKGIFSLTGCKMWSAKLYKNDVSNYGINLKKVIQRSPITILPMMFLAGEFHDDIEAVLCWVWFPHKMRLFLAGFDSPMILRLFFRWVWGGFYGFRLWEIRIWWVQVMAVKLVQVLRTQGVNHSDKNGTLFRMI